MKYSASYISKIMQKIIAKVRYEVETASENDCLEEVIEKYGIVIEDDSYPVFQKQHKILVLGALSGKLDDFKAAAIKIGLSDTQLVFESDYDKLTNFNSTKLMYSQTYSDVIYGPVPHKIANMGDYSCLFEEMTNNPGIFPRAIKALTNGDTLKITMSSFKDALLKTRLIESNY